jgi:hypothetical protein
MIESWAAWRMVQNIKMLHREVDATTREGSERIDYSIGRATGHTILSSDRAASSSSISGNNLAPTCLANAERQQVIHKYTCNQHILESLKIVILSTANKQHV